MNTNELTNYLHNKFKEEGKYVAKRFIKECIEAGITYSQGIDVVGKPMIPSAQDTSGKVTPVIPDTHSHQTETSVGKDVEDVLISESIISRDSFKSKTDDTLITQNDRDKTIFHLGEISGMEKMKKECIELIKVWLIQNFQSTTDNKVVYLGDNYSESIKVLNKRLRESK